MHANMHLKLPKYALKTPKYALKNSKTSTTNLKTVKNKSIFFYKRSNFLIKCICQKVFSRHVKWLKNFVGEKDNNEEKFSKMDI